MDELYRLLARTGGLATTRQLHELGFTKATLASALRQGHLVRVSRGFYAAPTLSAPCPEVMAAVRAGGGLSGASALALHGAWRLEDQPPVVRLARPDRARAVPGLRFVTLPGRHTRPPVLDSPADAFAVALRTVSREDIVVLGDSLARPLTDAGQVLRGPLLAPTEMRWLARHEPAGLQWAVGLIDGRSESGTESRLKFRLASRRVHYQQQFHVPDTRWWVDFLVGDRLVIEADSRAHHTDQNAYQQDRKRDRALVAAGYLVFRYTYADVHYHWPTESAALWQALARRLHRRQHFLGNIRI
ncbi:type IV toxin-antitoxin system AbiEi family antitoxin domain-containing protein [Buchananella hordeovulneris]|uniref:Uncharacterized protein n=1 Tax=Buchananella hordeovulneris TaxID=52770 RepID=A0A1Q5PTW3_9ACTO|nr:type IV toxin-antitoxin system AbiEi family antitoxin domain-containing protein [Buchananella hordeovulneris]OKL51031.1 hypothetical protein BSZ40_09760 [Buchananella hordeovulneris]